MIRIERGDEPPELRLQRVQRLTDARAAILRGNQPCWIGYHVARPWLYHAQHGKCAYCEMQHLQTANPTEHFRPKGPVLPELDHPVAIGGYWWLAWSWRNLLFSCTTCNSAARKGRCFALALGSTPLVPEQDPPGDERPMLIDPSDPNEDDPIDHIVFVRRRIAEWIPRPRRGSARGDYTIATLGLDHPDLSTLYRDHVERTIQPQLDALRAAIHREDPEQITKIWKRSRRVLFHPRQRFHALSFDVLDASIPESVRKRWRLPLPRP